MSSPTWESHGYPGGATKFYKFKASSLVKKGSKGTTVEKCGNCGRELRITPYWKEKKRYKNFYCDRKCTAEGQHMKENPGLVGGYLSKDGYQYVQVDGRKRLYHRMLLERLLGRKLEKHEHVHHMNGIRNDNRIENLVLTDCHSHPTESLRLIHALQSRIRDLEGRLAHKKRKIQRQTNDLRWSQIRLEA